MKLLAVLFLGLTSAYAQAGSLGYAHKEEVLEQTIFVDPGIYSDGGGIDYAVNPESNLDAVCVLLGEKKAMSIESEKLGDGYTRPSIIRVIKISAEGKIAEIVKGTADLLYINRIACE